jgi:hypothetical protein
MRNLNRVHRHDSTSALVVKYWIPAVLLVGVGLLSSGAKHAAVLALPVIALAFFGLCAAEIKPGDADLQYRRFLKWKHVPYAQISECRVSWVPAMGYIRTLRFVPPWGKIYFVLDGPTLEWAMPGGQTRITAFINARRTEPGHEAVNRHDRMRPTGLIHCGLAAGVGALSSLFGQALFPGFGAPWNPTGLPHELQVWQQALERATQWPWALVLCALLLAGIFWLRFKDRAWILAFGLGAVLASAAVNVLR